MSYDEPGRVMVHYRKPQNLTDYDPSNSYSCSGCGTNGNCGNRHTSSAGYGC